MIRFHCILIILILGWWSCVHADSNDWRTTAEPPALSAPDMQTVGSAVCGIGGYEESDDGLKCSSCPEFTGNAGSDSGLEIGRPLRGNFIGDKAGGDEWIVDTEGCEAHFAGFGGAVLLAKSNLKPLPGSPAAVLGSKLAGKPSDRPLSLVYYKPGFRLNDCLIFNGKGPRSLLVCNEADIAQGEVIGHISVMEISKREITRWRLLRWYDNSATNMAGIVSVLPTEMHQVQLANGQQALQITMTIVETTRDIMEKAPGPLEKTVTLVYQRKGQRLFATPETQQLLGDINLLTGKMLD